MDLDKLKATWQHAEVKPIIDQQKALKILDNQGMSAYEKLVKYEKIGLVISIILILSSLILLVMTRTILKLSADVLPVYLVASSILVFTWQRYKYRYLIKLDILRMDILQISRHINVYKKYLSREWLAGILWAIIFLAIFAIEKFSFMSVKQLTITLGGMFTFMLLPSYILYKYTTAYNIKNIEASIKEVEEIERDNIE